MHKVAVIGSGAVGCSYIYSLMQSGTATDIVLVDKNQNHAKGEAMDLSHGLPFTSPASLEAGEFKDCSGANLVVVTAGSKQRSGESRTDLLQRNASIIEGICDEIATHAKGAVVLVVSNPVDVLTFVAMTKLGWPKGRVLGSGTVLDSARFRHVLGKHCKMDSRSVHGYILGEHGDSEFAAWSTCSVGGQRLKSHCPGCPSDWDQSVHDKLFDDVRNSAYEVIDLKGSTFYGIGLSVNRISQAILRDERSVLPVSTMLDGEFGLKGVCLSLPCVVGREGVHSVLTPELSEDEIASLRHSAQVLQAQQCKCC
ncbi:hypothetical protein DIPPA_56427 [Diplonema papillatum]|nr:hypothetical protein DIPPA_56427 [Diplonema papillatum]